MALKFQFNKMKIVWVVQMKLFEWTVITFKKFRDCKATSTEFP